MWEQLKRGKTAWAEGWVSLFSPPLPKVEGTKGGRWYSARSHPFLTLHSHVALSAPKMWLLSGFLGSLNPFKAQAN